MPLVQTRGAASAQGFGEFAQPAAPATYIEDVFSTYLWDGNSTARSIVNGIDLATKGGLVWAKYRNTTASNRLYDTNRGATKQIFSDLTNAEQVAAQSLTSFNADGFSLGTGQPNETTATVVGWTFRKQPKFFDVVTFNADLSKTNQRISHNLGSVPGTIIIKCTNVGGSFSDWWTYHRSLGRSAYLTLNSTTASTSSTNFWGTSDPTSTDFGFNAFDYGLSGGTYVAYLFAHDAGGFGTSGTDNVISCGSYTGNGSATGPVITLGYEPQWILVKRATGATSNWQIIDVMRGVTAAPGAVVSSLFPNLSDAENAAASALGLNSTGFQITNGGSAVNASGSTYIYMAIRRGPMKTPTTGTSVFGDISALEPVSTNQTTENGVLADLVINGIRINQGGFGPHWLSRLTGNGVSLVSSSTAAEFNPGNFWNFDNNNFAYISPNGYANNDGTKKYVAYSFKRAPGFFDVVCYTGTGSATTFSHNLGAVPELMIVKRRNAAGDNWAVYAEPLGNTKWLRLDDNYAASTASTIWNNTTPTSSVFSVGSSGTVNASGGTFVAYLFATVAGVSKVGSYTGTGSTQTINCGFTGGARWVLIRRTDDWDGGNPSGNWWIWDTARGMISGTDPRLTANTTAAQSNADWVYTTSVGFQIVTSSADVNASGGTYIFLAIA